MSAEDALRFLDHESGYCRCHDQHEALCLLLPGLLRVLDLEPMNSYEAEKFRSEFRKALREAKC
ncbi:MAG TPA: hypothetical protein VG146_01745 [Verrucomicrobiae bacterium]|nr:hypothetical protein [Verrucomicrobiae bacterium]